MDCKAPGPFLRWAGGKRWIAERLVRFLPRDFGTYFEPFLGGGAVFFRAEPAHAVLSDLNPDLIRTYRCVRDQPDELIAALERVDYSQASYQQFRTERPTTDVAVAVRLIYLNRTSWNGLYRVNSKGFFNVPRGTAHPFTARDAAALRIASAALRDAELLSADFEPILSRAQEGDLVYLDPPYTVTHDDNGFVLYNERIFSWEDHLRLARVAMQLARLGVYVVLSDADHPSIRDLFDGFVSHSVSRASILAADPAHRRRVRELVLTSFS